MQIKYKKLKIILMMIIAVAIISISSVVFGADLSIANPPSEPYMYDGNLFCINHNQSYWVMDVRGMDESSRLDEYTNNGTKELEQSVAFAFYTALNGTRNNVSLQQVIWSSGQFAGEPNYVQLLKEYTGNTTSASSSDTIIARSNQFAQFYYGILNGGNNPLTLTSESTNSKVLVDYTDKTYTVGPYKIDVTVGHTSEKTSEAKSILYNELAGINAKNYPGGVPFASYTLSGVDGTNVVFIDKSGNVIEFPNWGEEFYIRYKPNNGVTTINPKIKIQYISKVTGKAMTYDGSRGEISGTIPKYSIYIEEGHFNPADIVTTGTLKDHGNWGATIKIDKVRAYNIQKVGGNPQHNDPNDPNKITGYDPTYVIGFDYTAEISTPSRLQDLMKIDILTIQPNWKDTEIDLGVKEISMELGGNVWVDLPDVKVGGATGKRKEKDISYAGMQVELFDENGAVVGTTTTDKDGKYHFYGLDPLKKYYVRFTYNGQIYQSTYYKNNLTGGYSNAQDEDRDRFNNKFGKIDSTPENYKVGNEWHKSYALLSKLAKDNGEYIQNGQDSDGNAKALTFEDAWNKFVEFAASTKSYASAYNELSNWLGQMGVGSVDRAGVITFIKDSMITATTHIDDPLDGADGLISYPVYDRFVLEDLSNPTDEVETVTLDRTYSYLYTKKSDQSRYVDYGINRREQEELYLQKDVFKATVIVNGKKHDYMYSKKNLNEDGSWSVEVRAADELYNGRYSYSREIRKSEYLYDGSDAGSSDAKNLQVFVTYRIAIRNASDSIYASVNEIVDYYDSDQYSFDGRLQENGTYSVNAYNNYDENGNVTGSYVNSYLGSDANGTKLGDVVVSNNTSFADREQSKVLTNGSYKYDSLYVTGIKSVSGNNTLAPGEFAFVYLTFKANVDETTGKVKLDQDLNTGNVTIGKRNIAEINGYSTYYNPNALIPGYLNADDSRVDTNVGNRVAGIIDTLSNAGSLEEIDLTNDGDLRTSSNNEVENRLEMDTDKAPNIKVIITQNDDDTRRLTGYVYEDERTVTNDKAVVGNGKYDENETKVNGVKVELVELVQNVDDNGIFLGSYNGEKVWGTNIYEFQNGQLVKLSENNDRYFSGIGLSKVILKGPGILDVVADNLGENNGEYSFKSVPAGDFFIRFTYGDNTQTVLTNTDNEVNSLVGAKGLNVKSYNGQDYKSTTYQAEIDQSSSYNGIKGFGNYDNQNYYNNIKESTDKKLPSKDSMYYYDIAKSENVVGASDAKDVYGYRESVNNWSRGADGETLLNNRAETLASFEKLGTFKYQDENAQKVAQLNMIDELIKNTQMVAQTGVIDTEVEYNSKQTQNQGNDNKLKYTIGDIDLGLQERPKAQVKLNKEIKNFMLVLANGQKLFDTTQSVNNLYFAKHEGHSAEYKGYRLVGYNLGKNSKQVPELVQAYLDEELIAGAKIQANYDITAQNVGEVDYLDRQFYYTGKTNNAAESNVSKTNVKEITDYVSNMLRYESNYQDVDSSWKVQKPEDLIKSTSLDESKNVVIDETKLDQDLVNREYYEKMKTYNILLTTDKLTQELLPELFDKDNSAKTTKLVLSAMLSDSGDEDYVYNNLTEIVATSNTQGRRMAYSISGNQEMSDQSLGRDTREDVYTFVDLVTPSEMDSDSSQRIVILPPTGENRNFVTTILIGIAVALILTTGVVIIKKRVN